MKNTKIKRWHVITIGVLLSALCIAFAACGDTATKETDAPESVTTTTITEITTDTKADTTTTAVTTKTTSTTAQTTETADKATTEKATTTVKAAEPLAEKKTTAPKQDTPAPKKTTAKPAQQTPSKTTAAPKGHYETVHHEAVTEQVWVEDSPAEVHYKIVCRCGKEFNNYDEYVIHDDTALDNGDDTHYSYQNIPYETPARGHYETKVIQAAYDEQVWVQD